MNADDREKIWAALSRFAAKELRAGYKIEAVHEYTSADGVALFYRARLKHPVTRDKWIRPLRTDGGSVLLGEPKFESLKPLYRLHELTNRPTDPVFIVEGEKCADALAELGSLATTSGGADSVANADWSALRGRDVILWPDNDEPGRLYATAIAAALGELDCRVRVVEVDKLGLDAKQDVVDWLALPAHARCTLDEVPTAERAIRAIVETVAETGNAVTDPLDEARRGVDDVGSPGTELEFAL